MALSEKAAFFEGAASEQHWGYDLLHSVLLTRGRITRTPEISRLDIRLEDDGSPEQTYAKVRSNLHDSPGISNKQSSSCDGTYQDYQEKTPIPNED